VRRDRRLHYVALAGTVAVMGLALLAGGDDDPPGRPTSTAPTGASSTTSPPAEQQLGDGGTAGTVVVESITDGDTFRTTDGRRVRLIGVDTPEVDQDQCLADEATAALAALIPPGATVRLELDIDPIDRYGRTLAYVHRPADDLDVGLQLARDGYAVQLTVPPNVAREALIGAAVASARDAGLGLWGPACADPQSVAPPATSPPVTTPPATTPPIQPALGGACDPSYPDVCIPPAPPDLDCGDIAARRFTVLAPDPHGFDGNHDGVGCES
jgi:micrococcal nuclease